MLRPWIRSVPREDEDYYTAPSGRDAAANPAQRPTRAGYRLARYTDPPIATPLQGQHVRDWDAE